MVSVNPNAAADAVAATEYGRPEDLELIGGVLYVANTTEDRVIAIDLSQQVVSTFVLAGLNVPVEDSGSEVTGFNNSDNLAAGPDGRLWVVEDNRPSDIWATDDDLDRDGAADGVHLFASMLDPAAEGTGIFREGPADAIRQHSACRKAFCRRHLGNKQSLTRLASSSHPRPREACGEEVGGGGYAITSSPLFLDEWMGPLWMASSIWLLPTARLQAG